MSETHYIRNRRPNAFNLRVGGRLSAESVGTRGERTLSVKLGRRGTRSDSAALGEKDFKDTQIQQALRKGNIEEISEEVFLNLADQDYSDDEHTATAEEAQERSTSLKRRAGEKLFTISTDTNTEYIVPEFQPDNLNYMKKAPVTREQKERARKLMKPSLEYIEEPKPTKVKAKRRAAKKTS